MCIRDSALLYPPFKFPLPPTSLPPIRPSPARPLSLSPPSFAPPPLCPPPLVPALFHLTVTLSWTLRVLRVCQGQKKRERDAVAARSAREVLYGTRRLSHTAADSLSLRASLTWKPCAAA
eukprot:169368-Rhodomonas_salina.1